MKTFQERLRYVIKNSGQNQTEFAHSAGLNPATVSELLNGKTSPQQGTIEKIADYGHVNAEWLKNGTGYPFDPEKRTGDDNIPPSKRLAWCKGKLSVEAFAKKCGIDKQTMEKYLSGIRCDNKDCEKIAIACNVSLGWLTNGEPWQSNDKPYTGFSLYKHEEIGKKLCNILFFMRQLTIALYYSYPLSGKLARAYKAANNAVDNLESTRHYLEENYYIDNPDEFTPKTYYGNIEQSSTREQSVFEELFQSILEYCKDNEVKPLDFIDVFTTRFPEYKEWFNRKTIIKNAETGWPVPQIGVLSTNEPVEEK